MSRIQASQGSWLTRQGESLRRTFTICEETCLDAGTHLGNAIPGLMDLGSVFESLSRSLDSNQLDVAKTDLFEASGKMGEISRALVEETATFTALIALNKSIESRVASLSEYLRVVNALVFNIKIEAVSLTGSVDNMMDFADNLRSLVNNAQSAFDEYQKTHLALCNTLRNAFETQTSFQKNHQETLVSVSSEIAEQLVVVDQRRHQVTTTLKDLGSRSQHIGAQIGQCVFALQIGDSTRQRIEHAHDALEIVANSVLRNDNIWADSFDDRQIKATLASICMLQADQLEGAAHDFDHEIGDIDELLRSLKEEAIQLAQLGVELFGSGNKGGYSFLGTLEQRLKAVLVITEQYRRARSIVDDAGASIGQIVDDLNIRTKQLSSIISDMTILGMNAILKSGRAGVQGRGLNIIAQELRDYAMKVVQGIQELPVALAQVADAVEQLNRNSEKHNAAEMASLAQRMNEAISSVGTHGSMMTNALERLDLESASIRKTITDAIDRLAGRSDINRILQDAISNLRKHVSEIGDPAYTEGSGYEKLGELLYAKYTMASERDIHNRMAVVGGAMPATRALAVQEDEADLFML